jgi:hypothetical protein
MTTHKISEYTMKIKIECVIELDESYWFDNEEDFKWFKSVLEDRKNTLVILHSNDVGDEIGSTSDFKYEILKD